MTTPPQRFAGYYDEFFPRVFRYAYRRVGARDADDVTSEHPIELGVRGPVLSLPVEAEVSLARVCEVRRNCRASHSFVREDGPPRATKDVACNRGGNEV